MAKQVASLFGVLSLDNGDFIKGLGIAKSGILEVEDDLSGLGGGLTSAVAAVGAKITEIGGKLTVLGGSIQTLLGPIMDIGKDSLGAAVDFDESMKNIQAAAGYTTDEMAGISDQVRAIGANSRYGPGQAAQAFYDIAGGVSDANARMGTFEAVIAAAQAGNADLGSTTKAMISIMNDYKFSADQAGFASDVLTRMVGTGVGSMNDFAGAIPKAASAAAGLGISFDDVGSQMAFLTTKGYTASEAATKLSGMMSALISPSKEVSAAIENAGYTSGRAMIAAEGLTGAYEDLSKNNGGNLDGLIQNQEALTGATALATDEFKKFDDTFKGSTVMKSDGPKMLVDNMDLVNTGIQGATDAAQAIQMTSAASQIDLLNSSIENLKIAVGTDLMPLLTDLLNNTLKPLVQGIMDWVKANPQAVMGIAVLVGATTILGIALTVAGTALSAIGTAITVLSGPIGLAIGAVILLGLAYAQNFGGIKDFIDKEVAPVIGDFIKTLQNIWTVVGPPLTDLANFFITGAMQSVMDIFRTSKKLLEGIVYILQKIWDVVGPGVTRFASGVKDALGPVATFIQGIADSIQSVLDKLGGINGVIDTVTGNTGGDSFSKGQGPRQALGGGGGDSGGGGGGQAAGGPVMAGVSYTVGEQGREVFVPQSNGTIIPNNQLGNGGGISVSIGAIYANDAAGGRAAAESFDGRLRELQASRGGR